jgi:hypothetical protein
MVVSKALLLYKGAKHFFFSSFHNFAKSHCNYFGEKFGYLFVANQISTTFTKPCKGMIG